MEIIHKVTKETLNEKLGEIIEKKVSEYISENTIEIENLIVQQMEETLPKIIKKTVAGIAQEELGYVNYYGDIKVKNQNNYEKIKGIFNKVLDKYSEEFQQIAKTRVERVINKSEISIRVD